MGRIGWKDRTVGEDRVEGQDCGEDRVGQDCGGG